MSGWIKLHRKINDNPILKKGNVYSNFEAFIWLLLKANYDDAKVVIGSTIYKLKKGEMITSLKKLQKQFGWGNSRLKTFLKLLKDDEMINYKSNTQLTLITISNYKDLQGKQTANKSQPTHKQPTNNLQPNTNKKNKEEIKKNKENNFINQVLAEGLKTTPMIAPDVIDAFCNYWTERNMSGRKMKFEMAKTFDIKRRLSTWIRNKKEWSFEDKEEKKVQEKDDLTEKRYAEQMKMQKEYDANAPTDKDFKDIKSILKNTFKKD